MPSFSATPGPAELRLWAGIAGVLAACVGAPANAALSDTIHPFVSLNYSYDDNLFRLPDAAPGFGGERSDRLTQSLAGFSFDRPVGRQLFTGQAKVSRVSFERYSQLDYTGKDFSGTWEWHLANHLEGHLGGNYSQTLTSFTDFHTDERNLRTQRREFVDGAWRFHPSWRVRSGFTREKFNYDLRSQASNDRIEDLAEAGVDYLASSGSSIGLVARHLKGTYPNHRSIGGVALDDGYQQDEIKVNGNWSFSGVTQAQFLVGWARREHNFFVERDSSGLNGRINLSWKPTGKIRVTAAGWREFAAVESSVINSSLNKGASVGATYDLSSKLQATATYRREKRDFSKVGGTELFFPGAANDSSRSLSGGLTYVPQQLIQLGLTAYHDQRTGSPFIGTSAYKANGMSVSLTAQF